jgi:hypothetical protein
VTSSSEARVPHDFDTDAGLLHFAADCCDDRLTPSAIARVRELADLRPLEAAVLDAAKAWAQRETVAVGSLDAVDLALTHEALDDLRGVVAALREAQQ